MIYRAAGVCSVHPGPFTLGELAAMLEQRERSEWERASSVMCVIASVFAGKGKRYTPGDFNPFRVNTVEGTVNAKDLGQLLGFRKGAQG